MFLIVLGAAAIRGASRGFIKETLTAGAVICGLCGAILFSGVVTTQLERYLSPSAWNAVLSFLALFIVIYLAFKLSQGVLLRVIEKIRLANLDRALGLLLGIVEGVCLLVLFLLLVHIQPFLSPQRIVGGSIITELLAPLLPYAVDFLRGRVLGMLP